MSDDYLERPEHHNQDWLAPKSNLTDQQAYDTIVDLWQTVSDEQWRIACADLANAGLPIDERHKRYVAMLNGVQQSESEGGVGFATSSAAAGDAGGPA